VPDDTDYAALGDLLADPTAWSKSEATRTRRLLEAQQKSVAAYDQRDLTRLSAMEIVAEQRARAIAVYESPR
jgi:hypothetical protein